MTNNTKSSITLPHAEVVVVDLLKKRLKLKSRVSVIRKALAQLKENSEREALREQFRKASRNVTSRNTQEMRDLDLLSSDALDED